MNPSRIALALALAALSVGTAPAAAQPIQAEQRSRALFDQARQLADADRWTEACPLFQASHDLNSTGGTALQTANCYEKTGKPERALPLYEFIVSRPDAQTNPERLAIAKERARTLRRELGLDKPGAPPPAPPPPAPVGSAAARPPPPEEPPRRAPAYVAFGVGGAGLVVGAVAGALALSQASDVNSRCEGTRCPAADEPNRDAAITKGWVSTVGFGVGVAGAAVGIVLLATGGTAAKRVAATPHGITVRF